MRILLLAGTGEAKLLARRLTEAGHLVTASLAGATRRPDELGVPTRVGGFGGNEGFRAWLEENPQDAVVDATHPFAHRITSRSAKACAALGLPFLQLLRRAWVPDSAAAQHEVASIAEARAMVEPRSRIFLATGRQTLPEFAAFSDCYLICRQIDPPAAPFPFPNGEYLLGRPPFKVVDEIALFERLSLDYLIVKNAGGEASYTKITAAARIGLPVIMLARPEAVDCARVETVDDVLAWVASQ